MTRAFLVLCEVHELLQLLDACRCLPLTPEQAGARNALQAELDPEQGWSRARLARFESGTLGARTAAFLASLAPGLEHERTRRRLPLVDPAA